MLSRTLGEESHTGTLIQVPKYVFKQLKNPVILKNTFSYFTELAFIRNCVTIRLMRNSSRTLGSAVIKMKKTISRWRNWLYKELSLNECDCNLQSTQDIQDTCEINDSKFVCVLCQKSFTRILLLNNYLKRFHKINSFKNPNK